MGHKILDVKADIHEDVEKYFATLLSDLPMADFEYARGIEVDLLDIIDKHCEKIER